MVVRAILILVFVVAVALFGAVVFFGQQARPQQQQEVQVVIPTTRVLVAARNLASGRFIRMEDLTVREVPTAEVTDLHVRDTEAARSALRGSMLRRTLGQGESLALRDVINPGDRGFLAAVLRPGMRAVTVGVDAISGTAGLIWPGDRIDLILSVVMDSQEGLTLGRRIFGETVASDVRVIAVDQTLAQGVDAAGASEGRTARTVTLEVTRRQAEEVVVATRVGRLSLTVRSIEDPSLVSAGTGKDGQDPAPGSVPGAEESQTVYASDVARSLRSDGPTGTGHAVRVFNGTKMEEINFR
ncbi:MAG: Flp pilus assembly protein CpaB [Alphaproteobacteria bacterium]|nr:Flp pilus assembly protein CpaB [Alphaproteobacteria bacterium]